MYVTMYAEEAFSILEPFLPRGTKMTSAYRGPREQLQVIRTLADRHNQRHKKDQIPLPAAMDLGKPETWLPTLRDLRNRGVAVNSPVGGHNIPVSPHTILNIVFDMSGADLTQIEGGCRLAEKLGVIGFQQIKKEGPPNNAVHVHVKWISSVALEKLYKERGSVAI